MANLNDLLINLLFPRENYGKKGEYLLEDYKIEKTKYPMPESYIKSPIDIMQYIIQAYERIMNKKVVVVNGRETEGLDFLILDRDITIYFTDDINSEHEGVRGTKVNYPIQGFVDRASFSRTGGAVFVRNDRFYQVMPVIGHEIGHLVSEKISDETLEEAKAYAFEFAWCNTITEHNIGNLNYPKMSRFRPSNSSPKHRRAFDFVMENFNQEDPLRLFNDITNRKSPFIPEV